jgi:NlpC/P60 family/Bacterial dipeptidyl-peptidase Sh3 domain
MTSSNLDPNLHPYRDDLAALHLKGKVSSKRFVEATSYQVTGGVASLRKIGAEDGEQLSQALHGDIIDIFEEVDGFGWGQMRSDGYVGWFDMAALSAPVLPITRKVRALRTYALAQPDFKSPPFFLLSLGAEVCETGEKKDGFVRCERAGWVYEAHLAHIDQYVADPVATAQKFLEAPYQWGGVESLGLDCSGLVQTSFKAAGIHLPRDSYMMAHVGTEVGTDADVTELERGDIVCWHGHVGVMTNKETLLHANTHFMQVASEPLAVAIARIAHIHGPVLTARRMPH